MGKANAQLDSVVVYMRYTPFVPDPNNDQLAPNKDSADYIRKVTSPDSSVDPLLYPVFDYYLNGKPKLIGKSSVGSAIIKLEGNCVEFFPNGHKKRLCNYEHGKLVNDVVCYFPNGMIYTTGSYKNGNFILLTSNDSTGKVLVDNGTGDWIKYNDDFKKVYARGPVTGGLENGEWRGHIGDTVQYVGNYKNGVIVSGMSEGKSGTKYPFTKAEVLPEFKGGIEKFAQFLRTNIRYPYTDKQNGTQGRVILTFVIERDGSLTDLRVARSLSQGTDKEAMRVLGMSPKWVPGSQYGLPVRVKYSIPISFNLVSKWHN
jgi:TonB family protein